MKCSPKVQVNNTHTLSLIHSAGHLLLKRDKVFQVGPALLKLMLTGSDHQVVLFIPFDDLPGTEVDDRPVIPQILISALLVDGYHIC